MGSRKKIWKRCFAACKGSASSVLNPIAVASVCLNIRDVIVRRVRENFAGDIETEERYLRSALRKFPYWMQGHLALARLAYRRDDAQLCYISSQAVLQLQQSGEQECEARMLIGKSHLLRHEFDLALVTFQGIWKRHKSTSLREEIAACYFGMGKLEVAYDWLSDIPASEISPEAQAVLNYCKQKRADNSSGFLPDS